MAKELIEIEHKQGEKSYGSVVMRKPLLNEELDFSVRFTELQEQAFDAENKEIKSYASYAKLMKANADFFILKIVDVKKLKDVDETELSLDDIKDGKMSPELFRRLKDSYESYLKKSAEDSEGKKQG